MHKILIEVKQKSLSFSLYDSHGKVENLNDTNVVNTEKMVFSDTYINNNLGLIKSFFNLIVIKKDISTVNISRNAIFPLVFRIVEDIPNIKEVNLLEEKTISYIIFEYLLTSKYIEKVDCYSIPSFMFDKLDIDKNMKINSRCEVLFLSNFMEMNSFNTYSDVYYKKNIDIKGKLDKVDLEDIETFFRFNNNLKVINLYGVNKTDIEFILDIIKSNNKKGIKIVLNQQQNDKQIISLYDEISEKHKKLFKDNNLKLKISYTKEYRDKNTLKQVNLSFLRFILILFILLSIAASLIFYFKYKEDTNDINEEIDDIDKVIDLNDIGNFIAEDEKIAEEEEKETPVEDTTKPAPSTPNPYYQKFKQVFSELLKINDETVGWLKVNGTNINYPVTKHKDNSYYLDHSYYKQKNSHGWIFMDYRNRIDVLDKNTIIYGHRNNYGVMFANLKNVLEKKWYTNKNNQIITFNTLNANMKWQVFSIYTLKDTNDYLINNFTSDVTYSNFIKKIKGRSIYDFKVDVGVNDNILTLSTCYNNAEYRLVVHAKLIK